MGALEIITTVPTELFSLVTMGTTFGITLVANPCDKDILFDVLSSLLCTTDGQVVTGVAISLGTGLDFTCSTVGCCCFRVVD